MGRHRKNWEITHSFTCQVCGKEVFYERAPLYNGHTGTCVECSRLVNYLWLHTKMDERIRILKKEGIIDGEGNCTKDTLGNLSEERNKPERLHSMVWGK